MMTAATSTKTIQTDRGRLAELADRRLLNSRLRREPFHSSARLPPRPTRTFVA